MSSSAVTQLSCPRSHELKGTEGLANVWYGREGGKKQNRRRTVYKDHLDAAQYSAVPQHGPASTERSAWQSTAMYTRQRKKGLCGNGVSDHDRSEPSRAKDRDKACSQAILSAWSRHRQSYTDTSPTLSVSEHLPSSASQPLWQAGTLRN
jgi:hypothetical protein